LNCNTGFVETWERAGCAYRRTTALALEAAAEVIHNNVGAAAGEEDGIFATQTTTGTSHNNGLTVVTKFLHTHGISLFV
jgi:hypothetical protein